MPGERRKQMCHISPLCHSKRSHQTPLTLFDVLGFTANGLDIRPLNSAARLHGRALLTCLPDFKPGSAPCISLQWAVLFSAAPFLCHIKKGQASVLFMSSCSLSVSSAVQEFYCPAFKTSLRQVQAWTERQQITSLRGKVHSALKSSSVAIFYLAFCGPDCHERSQNSCLSLNLEVLTI